MVGVAFRLTLAKKSLCKPAKHERLNQSGNVPLQVQCCVFLSPGLPFVLDGKAPAQGAGQGGADSRRFQGALQGMSHEARRQTAVLLGGGELHRLLGGRGAGQRKDGAVRPHQPEIPGGAVVVQVFHAHRFQQKGLLVQLGVAAQIRRNAAFQPVFGSQRKIQLADLFGALQGETAVRIDKMKVNPSLLFFCVRQGRTSCRESFFGIIIAKFSQPKNNKAGNNIRFMTLCKKPVFGSFPRKNSTKSTRKCEETAQERKCSFCAAADLTTL